MSGEVDTTQAVLAEARAVAYGMVISGLQDVAGQLIVASEQVRTTYNYVEQCADGTDQIADQMARLTVDRDTVGEHRDAAALMRAALGQADTVAAAFEALSAAFARTAGAHRGQYGAVAATAQTMAVPMANASFYANR